MEAKKMICYINYNSTLLSTYCSGISTWEYPPDLWPVKNNDSKNDSYNYYGFSNDDNDDRTDLRGLSPWLRAARVKRTAEIASLMVIVSGTVSQSQES